MRRDPRTNRRRAAFLAGTVVTLIVAMTTGAGAGGASASFETFSVSARADLFHVQAFEDRAPIIPPGQPAAEFSPATAHAAIDSLGTSAAFAGAPYPGETVVGLPGLLAGLGGGDVPPLPAYPVYVSSRHPTEPDDTVDQGAYQLHSTSSATDSSARVNFGGGDGDAFEAVSGQAHSTVEVDGERVSAEATARLSGLVIPDVIDVGDIASRASITVEPDAEPQVETAFSVGVLTVAGIDLRIGPDGLAVVGTGVPIDLGAVEELLVTVGVDLAFIPAETGTTDGGAAFARSAGLRVETTQEGPDGESTRVIFEVGRTFASADARPAQQIDLGPVVDVEPAPTPDAPNATDAVPPRLPSPQPEVGEAPPPASDVAAPATPGPVATSTGPLDPGPTLTLVYAALGIGGVLSAASGRLLGLLGVRLRFGKEAATP